MALIDRDINPLTLSLALIDKGIGKLPVSLRLIEGEIGRQSTILRLIDMGIAGLPLTLPGWVAGWTYPRIKLSVNRPRRPARPRRR